MGDPWSRILKFLESKDEINQQVELKEEMKEARLKCLKMVKIMFTSRVMVIKM